MPNTPVTRLTRYANLLFGGLFAGFTLAVLALELALRGYDGPIYVQVRRVEYHSFTWLAAATYVPTLIVTVMLVVQARRAGRPAAFRPAAVALALLLLMLVVTLIVNSPINFEQLDWNVQAPPVDWAAVRDRWQLAHAVRTVAALIAYGCVIKAVLSLPAGTREPVRA
jgi:uncharacterized membrane protein